ncbi:MAG: hypothetical protein M3N98_08010 [Actinomycetota bacterium]|nr:hypothetical protein [Actinomycetota bacterium]
MAASGSQTALTVTVTFDEAVFPGTELSVTVRVSLHEHAELKVCFGFWMLLSADPSPKFLL